MKEFGIIDDAEWNYCAKVLNGNYYYKHQRREVTMSKFVEHKDKTKRDNAKMKVSSMHFIPLPEGKV